MFGGSANDNVSGGDDNDTIYGEGGHDTLSGDAGNDWVVGGEGIDYVYGDAGDDEVFGFGATDYLYGGDGYDHLYGGAGEDRLNGGAVGDYLTGGADGDTFVFSLSDGITTQWQYADTITDFDREEDWIDADVAGTMYNMRSAYIHPNVGGWEAALSEARHFLTGDVRHVFISDTVNGYLFSDQDGNGYLDSGLELLGLGSRDDLLWHDIV